MAADDYRQGFRDGWSAAYRIVLMEQMGQPFTDMDEYNVAFAQAGREAAKRQKKRKLSKWQQFVKAKSKLPRFKYKTGSEKEWSIRKPLPPHGRKFLKVKSEWYECQNPNPITFKFIESNLARKNVNTLID